MRGGDTSALRAFNERLIIGAIRDRGALSKAELARATGLSAQAASMIVNALVRDGLVRKEAKVRGQVGQPFTPIALDPEGAFSLGVKIGRRSVEAVVVDFLGDVVSGTEARYGAPLPERVMPLAGDCAARALDVLPAAHRARIVGLGIAMPGDLPAWSDELDLAPGALGGWEAIDVAGAFGRATGLEATLYNDATAACAAEMVLGEPVAGSALYLYLGTFVGGGLVLDGRLYRGARDNAAALGSMPMSAPNGTGRPRQLIHEASVFVLERALQDAGIDASAVIDGETASTEAEAIVAAWTEATAAALARAVVTVASVVDIEVVVVDGLLASGRIAAVTRAFRRALERFDTKGLRPFTVRTGSVGRPARVLGAALLPLNRRFAPDPDVLTAGPRSRAAPAASSAPLSQR